MNDEPVSVPELVPILPLPEVVLFPRQVLPLHIFEPRYRAMIADALAGERALAIALLKHGYERHYFTAHAPIHRIVGVGRISAAKELNGGKYDILLRGEARATLLQEYPGRPYRFGRIETITPCCDANYATRRQLRRQLCEAVTQNLALATDNEEHYRRLFAASLSLGELTDLVAAGLPIAGELRQCLLAEVESCARTRTLLEQVRTLGALTHHARRATQPAECSLN